MSDGLLFLILGLLGIGSIVVAGFVHTSRCYDDDRESFLLEFPRDVTAAQVLVALRSLTGLSGPSLFPTRSLVFEVAAKQRSIEHRLHIPRPWVRTVQTHLLTAIPSLAISPLATADQSFTTGVELELIAQHATLRTDSPETSAHHLLAATQPLGLGESLMLQWIVAPFGPGPRPVAGTTRLPDNQPWWAQLLAAFWQSPSANPERVSLAAQKVKVAEPLFRTAGRLIAQASSMSRARSLVRQLRVGLAAVEAPGAHLRPRLLLPSAVATRALKRRTPLRWTAPLNAAELRAVLGWPIDGPTVPGLALRRSRMFPPAFELPRTGRIIGDGRDQGVNRPVAQPLTDAMTHTWLLGKTGVGKSTLIANLALQDIASPARPGVVVIEPKRDLVMSILPHIPEDRLDDVILLDPASDVLVGLNPLRLDEPDRELIADQVYGVFQQLSTSWGPRLGDVLYNALGTLSRQPDACLTELPLILGDDSYRRRALAKLDDDAWVLRSFWATYDSLTPADRATIAAPILTRIRPWLTRTRLRQLIGVPRPRWSFPDVFNNGRILLIALNTGLLGQETVRLLGSLIFQNLWQTATARAALPSSQRRPVLVYADEWQDYTQLPTNLETMLSQARGYGLGLVLANQSVTQLSNDLRAAVTVHARSKIVMAVGSGDAAHVAREIGGGVTPDDIQGLGSHEAIASLMVGGQTAPPVSITTRPLPKPVTDSATVQAHVRERYGLDPAVVEHDIRRRHEPPGPSSPVNRRRRPS